MGPSLSVYNENEIMFCSKKIALQVTIFTYSCINIMSILKFPFSFKDPLIDDNPFLRISQTNKQTVVSVNTSNLV